MKLPESIVMVHPTTDVRPEARPVRRLLVLVPDSEADPVLTAQRVRDLALALNAQVHLFGLYPDPGEEPRLRRQLVELATLVGDSAAPAETESAAGRDWVEAVRARWQTGDLVVCFAGQRAGRWSQPLSRLLESNLDVPIFILTRLERARGVRSAWRSEAAAWTGFLTIVAGCLLLQVQIQSLAAEAARIPLFLLSVAAEVWLLVTWNRLTS